MKEQKTCSCGEPYTLLDGKLNESFWDITLHMIMKHPDHPLVLKLKAQQNMNSESGNQ